MFGSLHGKNKSYHHIKIKPVYFEAVSSGKKSFEIRFNDRNYKTGDIIGLHEFSQSDGYTGRCVTARIIYTLSHIEGLEPGYILLSIKLIKGLNPPNDFELLRSFHNGL